MAGKQANFVEYLNKINAPIYPLDKNSRMYKVYSEDKDKPDPKQDVDKDTELYYIFALRQSIVYDYDKNNYKLIVDVDENDETTLTTVEHSFLESIICEYKEYENLGQFVKANIKFFMMPDDYKLYMYHLQTGRLPSYLKNM
jgi:hypothetical protein